MSVPSAGYSVRQACVRTDHQYAVAVKRPVRAGSNTISRNKICIIRPFFFIGRLASHQHGNTLRLILHKFAGMKNLPANRRRYFALHGYACKIIAVIKRMVSDTCYASRNRRFGQCAAAAKRFIDNAGYAALYINRLYMIPITVPSILRPISHARIRPNRQCAVFVEQPIRTERKICHDIFRMLCPFFFIILYAAQRYKNPFPAF